MEELNLFNQESRAEQHPLSAHRPFQFSGSDYDRKLDQTRLTGQLLDIFNLMRDEQYRTLDEISSETRHPAASISAQLRHLRKPKFGSYTVNKRRRGDRASGLFEYQLVVKQVA